MEEHKTKIRIEIDKTIQAKQFEPIKIVTDIEETFYWTDEKDRASKMRKYKNMITSDFIKTFNEVITKLGLKDRCIGRVVTTDKSKPEPKVEAEDEFDLFDLD
jgi:hypothetical protein